MKAIFPEDLTEESLRDLVIKHCIVAWNLEQRQNALANWLDNFDGSALGDAKYERLIALWILLNFTFYTEEELKNLCRVAHAEFIHNELMRSYEDKTLCEQSVEQCKLNVLRDTLFVPAGMPGESGSRISYIYRQANDLSRSYFDPSRTEDIKRIVVLDDISISGHQASSYIKDVPLLQHQSLYFIPLFITDSAKLALQKNNPELSIISPVLIDERSKCFSNESFVFSSSWSRGLLNDALVMCRHYGNMLVEHDSEMKGFPLGYSNGQMLIGLPYNLPNNSLPIIWHDGASWKPFQKRQKKLYGFSENGELGSHYYV